ncbi:glucose-6-phosphate isomerase [Nanoarchaeota archaeon]|nr:MAG: glucose-6-phosphate isomerase [Nanoarchaeota archaeon]HEC45662.1 cupin domain-containing protein [Campylobacterota bacterium]
MKIVRKYRDMKEQFLDHPKGNPVIYIVYAYEKKDLSYAITELNAGKIGKEFYMTKGHKHIRKRPEVYYFIKGSGYIVLQKDNKCKAYKVQEGDIFYVEPGYAHRVVNTGRKKLVFLSVYPTDSGHDYSVKFRCRIINSKGVKIEMDNVLK